MNDNSPALDVTKTHEELRLEHDRPLLTCAFSPCGRFVVAGAQDEGVYRWELASSQKTTLAVHRSWVEALAFASEGGRLSTGDYHGTLSAWKYDDANPQPLWTKAEAHAGVIRAMAVSRDGAKLYSAGSDRRIKIWAAADGSSLGELAGHEHEVIALALHPGGEFLVSGDLLGRVVEWHLPSGERRRTLEAAPLHTRLPDFLADVGGVRALAFNAAGDRLAAGGMTDIQSNTFCQGKPAVLIYDWAAGAVAQTLRMRQNADGPVKGLAWLPDGTLAAHSEVLHTQTALEFFPPGATEPSHVVSRAVGYSLSLHPDGRRLAIASFEPQGFAGNGRGGTPEEYKAHRGAVVVYGLFLQENAA